MPGISYTLTVEDTSLFIRETNSDAASSILFLHGNSNSGRIWHHQLQSPLLREWRLIAADLPGHGLSGPLGAHLQPYSVITMGKVIMSAVKTLIKDGRFIVAGLSLGTNVLAEAVALGMNANGYVLFSPSIVGAAIRPEDTVGDTAASIALYQDDTPAHLITQYIREAAFRNDENTGMMLREDYGSVKKPFRSDLGASIPAKLYTDELETLCGCGRPVLCAFGEEDRITSPRLLDAHAACFWKKKVFKIPEAGHQLAMDAPVICNALLREFATFCFQR